MNKTRRTELWRAVKFTLISASAGIIQAGSFALLNELVRWPGVPADADYGPNYFIALALSVIWNFTFNRKYTFKSAANVPTAMLKVFCYYLVFTPLSIWWGVALTQKAGWNEYLVLASAFSYSEKRSTRMRPHSARRQPRERTELPLLTSDRVPW